MCGRRACFAVTFTSDADAIVRRLKPLKGRPRVAGSVSPFFYSTTQHHHPHFPLYLSTTPYEALALLRTHPRTPQQNSKLRPCVRRDRRRGAQEGPSRLQPALALQRHSRSAPWFRIPLVLQRRRLKVQLLPHSNSRLELQPPSHSVWTPRAPPSLIALRRRLKKQFRSRSHPDHQAPILQRKLRIHVHLYSRLDHQALALRHSFKLRLRTNLQSLLDLQASISQALRQMPQPRPHGQLTQHSKTLTLWAFQALKSRPNFGPRSKSPLRRQASTRPDFPPL